MYAWQRTEVRASESPPRTEPSWARGSPIRGAIRPWTDRTSTSRVPAPRGALPPIEPGPTLAMREHQLRDATRGDRRNPSAPSVVDVPLDRADRHAEQPGHRSPAPVPLVQPMQERSNALDRHAPTRPMTSSSPWQHPSLMSGPEHVWLSSDPTGMLQAVGGPVRRLPTAAVTHPVRRTAHGATPARGVRVLPPIGHRSTVYTVGMIHVTHLPSIAAVSEPARRARLGRSLKVSRVRAVRVVRRPRPGSGDVGATPRAASTDGRRGPVEARVRGAARS